MICKSHSNVQEVEILHSRVFEETLATTQRIVINRGGTRSTKTVSICDIIGLWLFSGTHSDNLPPDDSGVFTIFRRYKSDIERTVLNDWHSTLTKFQLWNALEVNKTLKTFVFGKRMVRFMGFDDEDALRGYASTHCYLNEADQMTWGAFNQVAPRTTGRLFIDFNPDDEDIWINRQLEQKRKVEKGDVAVIVSSYRDNDFLTDVQVEEIEYRQHNDPVWWAAFGVGEYASKRGRIFMYDVVAEVPTDAPLKGYGLDFGYTNSKTALVKCWETDTDLWFQGLLYESGLQNADIDSRLSSIITNKKDYIIADCAEPKAIDFLASCGWNIHPALKGTDSINNGISTMKGKRIHLVAGDEHLQQNFRGYKWKEDKNGNALNEPIKIDDHYPDAARYITTHQLAPPKTDRDFFN